MAADPDSALSRSEEEYLESIYKLTRGGAAARTEDIAAAVGVSAPAASGMIKRLAARGALDYERYAGARLTEAGERQALKVVRRHRLLERMLTDLLKLPWHDVHEQACRLEHSVMPQMEEKIEAALGGADTCPHGHPIPSADGRVAEEAARSLTELEAGRRARVVRIAVEAAEFLRYLASLGLLPGVEVTVETKAPFDGPIMVEVEGAHYALGREVAEAILVAPV